MIDLVLVAINARYSHASLGARCLLANLGALEARAALVEATLDDRPADLVERILALGPRVVGLGVYIWNVTLVTQVVARLKALRPDLPVILGGPEVSHEADGLTVVGLADVIVQGEGELVLPAVCAGLLDGARPPTRILAAPPPPLEALAPPYRLYSDEDLAHRVIYVEASRGCPYGCEFCLSALDGKVRRFDVTRLLAELDTLWRRGARRFKFVDRALHLAVTPGLLDFFLARAEPSLHLHFELVPEQLPDGLRERLAAFSAGAVQLEAGLQTLDPQVAARIGRRQDVTVALDNLRWLLAHTGVHLHADLIAGLPGESLAGFAAGFDTLFALKPHEIQLGILKRLRGAPIARHDAACGMVYSPDPPYEILETRALGFATMQRIKRAARVLDLVRNSGRFPATAGLVWEVGSPFARLLELSDHLHERLGPFHAVALPRLAAALGDFLVVRDGRSADDVARSLAEDERARGRTTPGTLPRRQARHRHDG